MTAKATLPPPPPGQFRDVFSLADAGASQIELHGIDSSHSVYFTLPQTHVPRSAKIHLSYAFSPSLLPQLSMIKLMMNGTLFATVQPTPERVGRLVDADRRRGIHHSAGTDGAQQRADHSVHRALRHGVRGPCQYHAVVARASQHLFRYPGRPAAAGRRPEAAAPAVSGSGGGAAPQSSGDLRFRAVDEGDPGGGHRHQLLRHDLGKPAGALPGAHWRPFPPAMPS